MVLGIPGKRKNVVTLLWYRIPLADATLKVGLPHNKNSQPVTVNEKQCPGLLFNSRGSQLESVGVVVEWRSLTAPV